MATTSIIISPLNLCSSSLVLNPKKHQTSFISCKSNLPISSSLGLKPSHFPSSNKFSYPDHPPCAVPLKTSKSWKLSAFRDNFFLIEANPIVENSPDLASTSDDGVSSIISVLLFVAFIGLSILTIGVIYIAVTDFLQKRERERFEREEAAKKKKGAKKGKIGSRARAGPRGFGQKIEENQNDDSE